MASENLLSFEERLPRQGVGRYGIAPDAPALWSVLGDDAEPSARTVYLDLETTGLSLGAGTLICVVGLGVVDGPDFVVRQYVLHDPGAEQALLEAVATQMASFARVVTFNGKRFDAPLFRGRYQLHRLPDPLPRRHVDLLQPAQRIWRRRLGSCGLSALEAQVLGSARESDIPGYDIPGRYFASLRGGDFGAFRPVLDHNRQDVVTMAGLASVMDRLLRADSELSASLCPSDLLGIGRLLELAGQSERARSCYEAALVGATTAERAEALSRLAHLAQKANQIDLAIQLFEALARYSNERAVLASVELAKLYEHRVKQPERALGHARRAYDLIRLQPARRARGALDDVARRVARLESKLKR